MSFVYYIDSCISYIIYKYIYIYNIQFQDRAGLASDDDDQLGTIIWCLPFFGSLLWKKGESDKSYDGINDLSHDLPSGKHTKNYGKSPFFTGKSTISTGPWLQ